MSVERMDKTAISIVDCDADRRFWQSKTPEERMAALDTMRQIAYGYDPLTARNQRVLEVVEATPR